MPVPTHWLALEVSVRRPHPLRCGERRVPIAMATAEARRWARTRRSRRSDSASPCPAGSPNTRRYAPPRRRLRSGRERRARTRTRDPAARSGLLRCQSSSSLLRSERLPKFRQSRTDSRLDGAERLLEPCCHFGIRQLGEERSLDRDSFVRCQDGQGVAQQPALRRSRRESRRTTRRLPRGAARLCMDSRASSAARTAIGRSPAIEPGS